MHQILPRLWLGDAEDAQDVQQLTANSIHAVFNITPKLPFSPQIKKCVRLAVLDDKGDAKQMVRMQEHLPAIVRQINTALKSRKAVLVHCKRGRQRSAAVVACYLCMYKKMTVGSAVKFVRSQRSVAFKHQITFQVALEHFYTKHVDSTAGAGKIRTRQRTSF